MLLTADLHLDDNPENEYRWNVFSSLVDNAPFNGQVAILGDLTDQKNRFSSVLVNRLVSELKNLCECKCEVYILMGNHDAPVNGPPFWNFLNEIKGIHYISEPTYSHRDRLWLPFSKEPDKDWKDVDWTRSRVAFLHQFLDGSVIRGNKISGSNIHLPDGLLYYAGDVHEPQKVDKVLYVGAPHPVDFGDHYHCRLLLLNEDYHIKREVSLSTTKKMSVTISNLSDLEKLTEVQKDDKIRIHYSLGISDISKTPEIESQIQVWAMQKKVNVYLSFDVRSEDSDDSFADTKFLTSMDVLKAFGLHEGIKGETMKTGEDILKDVINK